MKKKGGGVNAAPLRMGLPAQTSGGGMRRTGSAEAFCPIGGSQQPYIVYSMTTRVMHCQGFLRSGTEQEACVPGSVSRV